MDKNLLVDKFNKYIRNCQDEGYADEQQALFLKSFKLYQKCEELPWPVFNQI